MELDPATEQRRVLLDGVNKNGVIDAVGYADRKGVFTPEEQRAASRIKQQIRNRTVMEASSEYVSLSTQEIEVVEKGFNALIKDLRAGKLPERVKEKRGEGQDSATLQQELADSVQGNHDMFVCHIKKS